MTSRSLKRQGDCDQQDDVGWGGVAVSVRNSN